MPEQSLSAADIVEDAIARSEAIQAEYQGMIDRQEKRDRTDRWIRRLMLFCIALNIGCCVLWIILSASC